LLKIDTLILLLSLNSAKKPIHLQPQGKIRSNSLAILSYDPADCITGKGKNML
jgi:hypothetical protein